MTEKEFSELKPGDKVRIVSERPEKNWVPDRDKYLGQVFTIDRFCDFNKDFVLIEEDDLFVWDRFMIDHKLTAEELTELDKKPNADELKCCLVDNVLDPPMPIKYFLFVEDGSIIEETKDDIEQRNPDIKVIVYRKGARVPELKEVGKCER